MAAKTNQQEQKRSELKKVPTHFTVLTVSNFARGKRTHLTNYTSHSRIVGKPELMRSSLP
jgi:hypothetical protein